MCCLFFILHFVTLAPVTCMTAFIAIHTIERMRGSDLTKVILYAIEFLAACHLMFYSFGTINYLQPVTINVREMYAIFQLCVAMVIPWQRLFVMRMFNKWLTPTLLFYFYVQLYYACQWFLEACDSLFLLFYSTCQIVKCVHNSV